MFNAVDEQVLYVTIITCVCHISSVFQVPTHQWNGRLAALSRQL